MKTIVLSILLLLLVSDSYAQDNFARVARVFGRDVYMSDLNPTDEELRIIKEGDERVMKSMSQSQSQPPLGTTFQPPPPQYQFKKRSDEQIISEGRSHKLSSMIWDPIWEQFDRTHNVKPTKMELDDFARAMGDTMIPDSLANDPKFTPKIREESMRMVGEGIVIQWKRNKALYETYGGTVLFQQLNPMEAFGAMRKLLEIHEAKGDFQIYDNQLKQEFWKYYLREPLSWKIIKPDKVDYSQPWWLHIEKKQDPSSIR
jgi:hypothetical protein